MLTNKHNVFLFHFTAHFAAESTFNNKRSPAVQCGDGGNMWSDFGCPILHRTTNFKAFKMGLWALNKEYINIKVTK